MRTDWHNWCVNHDGLLRDAIEQIDRARLGIALVVDQERRLVGTITDGDVRRAMLARLPLDELIRHFLARKAGTSYAKPVLAPIGQSPEVYLRTLHEQRLLHLPLVDDAQRVAGLIVMDDFLKDPSLPVQAVVMAGGRGQRLHPLTADTPKPMLRVGDQPVLEIIVNQLREAGIRQVKVTTHHQPEKIAQHFGDGKAFGVELSYATEDHPLGTVGGLGLMEVPRETTLVINGDILTQVDFRAMVRYHREHEAEMTVAVRHYEVKVPYGVIDCDGPMVRGVNEKPAIGFFVNAGIYLLEPGVYRYLPNGQRFDMTDLIRRVVEATGVVVSFPVREYWLDIGQPEDYEQAQAEVKRLGGAPA
jgi:dTDP-glucose pyrophosphorylase